MATHKNANVAGDIEVTEKRGGVEKPKTKRIFTILAFVLPVATGFLIATNRMPDIISAVASFFVTDPVQGANIDRGYSVTKPSQLNILDTDASDGYVVLARLDPGINPNLTVRIWSNASTRGKTNAMKKEKQDQ